MDCELLLTRLLERKGKLMEGMFVSPPKDWPEFHSRLGQYNELVMQIEEVSTLIRGGELDQPEKTKRK